MRPHRWLRLVVAVLALITAVPQLPDVRAAQGLLAAQDMQAVANLAKSNRLPIMLVVASEDCPYCALLNEEILEPLILSGDVAEKIIIRELLIDQGVTVTDFDGSVVEARQIAGRYDAYVTPTLLFLDHAGREVTKRIRGINTIEFYSYYVERAIERALSKVQATQPVP